MSDTDPHKDALTVPTAYEHVWYACDFGRAEACCRCRLVVSRKVFLLEYFPQECVELRCSVTVTNTHRLEYVNGGVTCVHCGNRFPSQ